jgi:hypothetical protein
MALESESRDGVTNLGEGVWRLGEARKSPVLLARNLIPLCIDPTVFDRVRVAGASIRVITPASGEARRARRRACATAEKLAEISRERRAEKGRIGPHRHRC